MKSLVKSQTIPELTFEYEVFPAFRVHGTAV